MNSSKIGAGTILDKAIVGEESIIGKNCVLGEGPENVRNTVKPDVYAFNLVTVGNKTVIPDGIRIGKNTAISGVTTEDDYEDHKLSGGGTLIKAGEGL